MGTHDMTSPELFSLWMKQRARALLTAAAATSNVENASTATYRALVCFALSDAEVLRWWASPVREELPGVWRACGAHWADRYHIRLSDLISGLEAHPYLAYMENL